MKPLIQLKQLSLVALLLACFTLTQSAQAVVPAPDGGYPGFNTAEGQNALFNLTTGVGNAAVGSYSLFSNTDGSLNTALGTATLLFNVGNQSTGEGTQNTAIGAAALLNNMSGNSNNALGGSALLANTDGAFNEAIGTLALASSVHGASNVAIGHSALRSYTGGAGSGFNTAVGGYAGADLTNGSDNIYIGATAGAGVTNENGIIRIGYPPFVNACFVGGITGVAVTGNPVCVDANGKLGECVPASSFSMNELLKEREVVQQLTATTEKQAARIALQEGQINALIASLKQRHETAIAKLEAADGQQQKQIEALASALQKVSAQLEGYKPAPKMAQNN